jgi:prophage tail gpP-like protein
MSTQPITVEINGKSFEGWHSVTVSKSIEDFVGSFSIKLSRSLNLDFPIKQRSACVIRIEGEPVITGFVEKIEVDTAVDKDDITVSGRDRTADINDSTIILPSLTPPFTLETVAKKTLDLLGIPNIKIINNIILTPFAQQDGNIDPGGTAFDFIETYAKKKQVLLTTDGFGNIVFTRASKDKLNTVLTLDRDAEPSILNSKVTYDDTKRFNLYEAVSQAQTGGNYFDTVTQTPQQITNIGAKAFDNEIRRGRVYTFVPKGTTVKVDIKEKVKWEMNFRRAQSFIYSCIVQGFKPKNDNDIWRFNKLITVKDDFCQLNGIFLITSVQYTYSLNEGSKTSLKIMNQDAFTTIITKPEKLKQTTDAGGNYFPDEPAQHDDSFVQFAKSIGEGGVE